MTIFLEIAKQFLTSEITTIINTSEGSDQSFVNGALGFIGLGRNTDLSTAKRQLLGDLQRSISEYSELNKRDNETYDALIALILKCSDDIKADSKKKNYTYDSSGDAIQNLQPLLRNIFKKCAEYSLIDCPHDEDPMNVFRYYVALYSTRKIVQLHHPSVVSFVTNNPQLSVAPMIANEKERLIEAALDGCIRELDELRTASSNYVAAKHRMVRNNIEQLQRQNSAIYEKQGWSLGAPIRFGIFSTSTLPTAQAAGGLLDECLRQALAELTKNLSSLEKKQSNSEENRYERTLSR